MSSFHVIIPARYDSVRFPGKLLEEIGGRTVIERVYRQAIKASPKSVVIATDSDVIFNHAHDFGGKAVMTASTHQSGTDRIAEVVKQGVYTPEDIIVNVQGDEPFIPPALITQVAESLSKADVPMATLCWPIEDIDSKNNPNVVKVVRDASSNALYFSRIPIPAQRDNSNDLSHYYRHIGLYAYRASFLLDIVQSPVCALEATEGLEQLRVLWTGHKIRVEQACVQPLQDINTKEDLEKARAVQLN